MEPLTKLQEAERALTQTKPEGTHAISVPMILSQDPFRDFLSGRSTEHSGIRIEHGVGLLETAYCDQALARGDLVSLLPRWTSVEIPVSAVYPSRKFLPPRVTAFLKALATWKNPLWAQG